jgi:hypothetical protein
MYGAFGFGFIPVRRSGRRTVAERLRFRRSWNWLRYPGALVLVMALLSRAAGAPLDIGTRLEPFFDRHLLAETHGLLHAPGTPDHEGVVLRFDEPWEGYFTGFITVFKDGAKYRMYYRGWPTDKSDELTCYAESNDGRQWRKPALGLHAYGGRDDTNIILLGRPDISSDFSPFIDANPAARPDQRFKALGGKRHQGLFAMASADGVHWKLMHEKAVFRDGAFDSQNVPFWSEAEGLYVLYFRVFSSGPVESKARGHRTVARTTSKDFIHWSAPVRMTFGESPEEELYTNQTHPYYRAPQIYLSFPMRYVPQRQLLTADEARSLQVFPDREKAVSDAVFMTSRGGSVYDRTFQTAFFRPGPDRNMWAARNSMIALGVVPLGGGRMGLYRQHHYAARTNHLVLYSLREDGLASLRAGTEEGYLVTKPFKHAGTSLRLNFATSAVGWVKVEVQDAEGKVLEGFGAGDSQPQFGDGLDENVTWKSGGNWNQLGGRVIRLKISLRDADLFALQQR